MRKHVKYVYLQPGQMPPQGHQPPKLQAKPPKHVAKPPKQAGGLDGPTLFLLAVLALIVWGVLS